MMNFLGNAVVQAYANEIAQEEHKHVQFFRAAPIAPNGFRDLTSRPQPFNQFRDGSRGCWSWNGLQPVRGPQ
jgi:hypothetical protein